MESIEYLLNLHRDSHRLGPGSDEDTLRALRCAGLDRDRRLKVADIGCGTGASTRVLARALDADIVAVDLFDAFLEPLRARAAAEGLDDRITTVEAEMGQLPFDNEQFDLIWSEGAIYNMGFAAGIEGWRRFLQPGGLLVVSEITWLTARRPEPLQLHWNAEYPEIDLASTKMAQLETHGYRPEGYFVLPEQAWLAHYYRPMEARFEAFLARHDHDATAREIVDAERREIALYEKYSTYYGYGVYIARKLTD